MYENYGAGHYSVVASSEPTILQPQGQIPSTPSTLFPLILKFGIIFVIALWQVRKYTKRGRFGSIFNIIITAAEPDSIL